MSSYARHLISKKHLSKKLNKPEWACEWKFCNKLWAEIVANIWNLKNRLFSINLNYKTLTPASLNLIWIPLAESINLASTGFIYRIMSAGSPYLSLIWLEFKKFNLEKILVISFTLTLIVKYNQIFIVFKHLYVNIFAPHPLYPICRGYKIFRIALNCVHIHFIFELIHLKF